MMLRMTYELTVGFAEKIQIAGLKLQKLLDSKQSVMERKWLDLTQEQTDALVLLGYDIEGEKWNIQTPTHISAKRWSDMGLSDECRKAARQVGLGDEAWVSWQKSWIDKGYTTSVTDRWASLEPAAKKAAKNLGYTASDWKKNVQKSIFLRPWLNTRQEVKGVPIGDSTNLPGGKPSGPNEFKLFVKGESEQHGGNLLTGGYPVRQTVSKELLPVLNGDWLNGKKITLDEFYWTVEDALDVKDVAVEIGEGIKWSLSSVNIKPTDNSDDDKSGQEFALEVYLKTADFEQNGKLELIENKSGKPGAWSKDHGGTEVSCTTEDYENGLILRVVRLNKGILRAPEERFKSELALKEKEKEDNETGPTAKKIERLKKRKIELQKMKDKNWKGLEGFSDVLSDDEEEPEPEEPEPEPEPEFDIEAQDIDPTSDDGVAKFDNPLSSGENADQSFDVENPGKPDKKAQKKAAADKKKANKSAADAQKKAAADKKKAAKAAADAKKPKNKKKMLQNELKESDANVAHEVQQLANQQASIQKEIDEIKGLLAAKQAEIAAHTPGWDQLIDWGIAVDITTSSGGKFTSDREIYDRTSFSEVGCCDSRRNPPRGYRNGRSQGYKVSYCRTYTGLQRVQLADAAHAERYALVSDQHSRSTAAAPYWLRFRHVERLAKPRCVELRGSHRHAHALS